jgi:hypothetical protein
MKCLALIFLAVAVHRSNAACNTKIPFVNSLDTLSQNPCCVTIENQKHENYGLYSSDRDDQIVAYPPNKMGRNQIWKVVKNGPSYQLINVVSNSAVCTKEAGDVTKCPVATDFLQQWTVVTAKDSKYVVLQNANTKKVLEGKALKNGVCKRGNKCVEVIARDKYADRPRQHWKIVEKSCSDGTVYN